MRRMLKGLGRYIFPALAVIGVIAALGMVWLARSLPPDDGRIVAESLDGPVSIGRDENGIPHIEAQSRDDALAGLGFAHAQDRLWQMEVARMAGQGRLSEIFGRATLQTDVWLRTIQIFKAAERSYERYPADAKRALEAYAAGVNAWMARDGRALASHLPPEFVALGHRPEPWLPVHSVVVVKMMSVGLAGNVGDEINRLAMARNGLSSLDIAEVLPAVADDQPPPLPDLADLLGLHDRDVALPASSDSLFAAIPETGLTGEGLSNNWAVSGERTRSGLPVLANDPHLGLSAPSLWYLAHLRAAGGNGESVRNLVGATLAGAPLVLLGRNDRVAWGFTNTDADVQDLFVEKVHPDHPDRYLTPQGWRPFKRAEETILLGDGERHVFERRATRHGPVMPDGYRGLGTLLPEGHVAALQWTALAEDDQTMIAGLAVWDAATVEAFQAAMEPFITPMQSIVVADRDGGIGFVAPGRVPIRHRDNNVMGRAPVPGWDAVYDWQGTIAYDDLPRATDPPAGAIGTANTKMVDADYEPFLTFDWDETYRQERLDALIIDAEEPHDMAVSRAVQLDRFSPAFADLIPVMIAAVEREPQARSHADMLDDLRNWDFRMEPEARAPLIAMAWLREAMRAIFADDLGSAFDGWFKARAGVLLAVLEGPTERDWCDIVASDARVERCSQMLVTALGRAGDDLEQRFGNDMAEWRWGEAHRAVSEHVPFGQVPVLDRVFNLSVPSGGGPFTLDRGQTDFGDDDDPYANRHAASFRAIYDLADLDRSTYVITTGQSGNVFSPHYRDMAGLWREGDAVTITSDPADYQPRLTSVWQMIP